MYIIIHKYQRWLVNVERPQSKYLKNKEKQHIKITVCGSKRTVDRKPVEFRRGDQSSYVHFMLREK